MSVPKIPEGEYRFCLIMWEHEPVSAVELVKLYDDPKARAFVNGVLNAIKDALAGEEKK